MIVLRPLLVYLLISHAAFSQPVSHKALELQRLIQKVHIAPRTMDARFGSHVFQYMMEAVDPYGIYFNAAEVNVLQQASAKLPDEIAGTKAVYLNLFIQSYTAALENSRKALAQLGKTKITFDNNDYFDDSENGRHAAAGSAYLQRWQQYLKWRILYHMHQIAEDKELDGITPALIAQHTDSLKQEGIRRFQQRFAELMGDSAALRKRIESLYLNGIAQAYDPHTNYMSLDEKDAFDESLNSEMLDYGFEWSMNEDGSIKVDDLVPGSAAWKSSGIHVNDKIIAIKPEGGKSISVLDISPAELDELMLKLANTTVEFTVQSPDGNTRLVKLKKEKIRNEENVVRGWILGGEGRVGYISLPSFYTKDEDNIGTSCAEDMAREIVKLKKENIEGLILDLRYNGGGSMEEAAAMLGIFIDIGPLALLKFTGGQTEVMKDMNRGTVYDGPMVVLVNGASASASEVIAGTLQDYRKAVIAGSPTFGKATMQIILPLDSSFNPENYDPQQVDRIGQEKGFVKLTTGKMYRITGQSAQQQGVLPDIYFPDLFEAANITERTYPTSLPADSIKAALSFRQSQPRWNKQILQDFQNESVNADKDLLAVQQLTKTYKAEAASQKIPLEWKAFNAWQKQGEETKAGDADQASALPTFSVKNTTADEVYNSMDDYHKEMDAGIMEDMHADPSIRQSFLLIRRILGRK